MITIVHIHFRTTTLDHLDASWYTLSRQDFTDVGHVVLLDNNTGDDPRAIQDVVFRYPLPVPLVFDFEKHGDVRRTQSWSVNQAARLVATDWLFLTRTDFLLTPELLARLRGERATGGQFCTSFCHQMGCDAQLSNTDVLARHSRREAAWRQDAAGPRILIGVEPAHFFQDTDVDAGVWLAERRLFDLVGGLDERMVSWGYQQQVWQRRLHAHGVAVRVIPDYLFHHQHHAGARDPSAAMSEYIHASSHPT